MPRAIAILFVLCAAVSAQEPASPPKATAEIRGQVVSDTGVPVPDVSVQIYPVRKPGTPLPESLREFPYFVATDRTGSFEFTELPAGDFDVVGSRTGYLYTRPTRVSVRDGQSLAVALRLGRGGAITGRVFDEFGQPAAQVQVQAARLMYELDGDRYMNPVGRIDVTDDLGAFRVYGLEPGEYTVVAVVRKTPFVPFDGSGLLGQFERAPTYYPGTLNPAEAQSVAIGHGHEASALFRLLPSRVFRLSGTAFTSTGVPLQGRVRLAAKGLIGSRTESTSADGSFAFDGVAPGNYEIEAWNFPINDEAGDVHVAVTTGDVKGISVAANRGTTIRGAVVYEGAQPRFPIPVRVHGSGALIPVGNEDVNIELDGRFEVRHVRGLASFTAAEEGWRVSSITLGGNELLDSGIETAGKSVVSGVRITLSDRLTTVSGTVAGNQGTALPEYTVVLVNLAGVLLNSREALRTVRTDGEGKFRVSGLRAGSYRAGVLQNLESGLSPAIVDGVRTLGQRFSLDEGESVVLELEPTPGL